MSALIVSAVLIGGPIGILLGWSRPLRNVLFPVVEMLRPIPPLALPNPGHDHRHLDVLLDL